MGAWYIRGRSCKTPFRKINIKSRSIVLATAHPCKFPIAIEKAINKTEPLPDELNYILNEKEHYEILDNNVDKIKNYVKEKISWKPK